MRQMVHNIVYLTQTQIDLSELKANQSKDVVALRDGALVQQVDFEILEAADNGVTFDCGFGNEKDFIANDIAAHAIKQTRSSKFFTTKDIGAINITLNQASTKGKLLVRAMYFLPSQIMTEY